MINSTHVLIAGGQVEGPNEAFILDWQTQEYTMLPDQLTRERWNQVRKPTGNCFNLFQIYGFTIFFLGSTGSYRQHCSSNVQRDGKLFF